MDIARSFVRPIHSHTFISYQSHDQVAAEHLTHLLQTVGLRPWWDKDPGTHDSAPRPPADPRGARPIARDAAAIESALADAISGSLFVTVITSTHTLPSFWVQREIQIASRLQSPVYFWHLAQAGESMNMSVRRSGTVPSAGLWPQNIASVAKHYKNEPLASAAHVEFTKVLASHPGLNRIGHTIAPVQDVAEVGAELNTLIELAELIVHKGYPVNIRSMQELWPYYDSLRQTAEDLGNKIKKQYGRQIEAGRVPVGSAFRLKRPFALSRIAHLERLMNDESFRRQEFGRLDRSGSAEASARNRSYHRMVRWLRKFLPQGFSVAATAMYIFLQLGGGPV
jgi:hypothetical protein